VFEGLVNLKNMLARTLSLITSLSRTSLTTSYKTVNIFLWICPSALERQTILYSYITLLAVCVRTPRENIIYYILLAAKGAVSDVFACYLHPGRQGLAEP